MEIQIESLKCWKNSIQFWCKSFFKLSYSLERFLGVGGGGGTAEVDKVSFKSKIDE